MPSADEDPELAAYNARLAALAEQGPKTWRRRETVVVRRAPVKRLTARGLTGALFRYQLMANIVGVLIIPLFLFTGLHFAIGGFKPELAIFGVGHGYLYIVYLVTAGLLALKARFYLPGGRRWILLMFVAGLVPGLTFVVEWLVVTRKVQPLIAAEAAEADAAAGVSPGAR